MISAFGNVRADAKDVVATLVLSRHPIVVGHDGAGNADALGEFTVKALNRFGNPVSMVVISFDFTSCPGLRITRTQLQPGQYSQCVNSAAIVYALTGGDGIARFRIVGGWQGSGSEPNVVTISTDFSQRGWMSFAAFDLNGVGGLGGADLAAWAADYFAGTKHLRSDYDGDGSLGGADLRSSPRRTSPADRFRVPLRSRAGCARDRPGEGYCDQWVRRPRPSSRVRRPPRSLADRQRSGGLAGGRGRGG